MTPPDGPPDRAERLAADWARTLARHSAAAGDEVHRLTTRLTTEVVDGVRDGTARQVGERVGRALVEAGLPGIEPMRGTVTLLGERLRALPGVEQARVAELQAAVAAGFLHARQEQLLRQQDEIYSAALNARADAEAALRASEARFRALFREAAVGIGVGDVDGRILDCNDALLRMFGYTLEEMQARNVGELVHPDDAESVWRDYEALVRGRQDVFRTEKRFYRKDGTVLWTHLTVSLIRDEDDVPRYQVAILQDVTVQHELQQRLRYEATHDPLTGLPNRALFLERLTEALRTSDPAARVGLCFLDLDGFKVVNDSLGHATGDALLVGVAERLTATAEPLGGFVARLGGDEFVALLAPCAGRAQVEELAGRLVGSLETAFDVDGHELTVTASAGVVDQAATETTPVDLLRAADITLHWAKVDGKARAVFHDPTRNARQVTRYTLARGLPGAMERDEFGIVYQPLVRLGDGGPYGVEALLRWHHPHFGTLEPDRFIASAEESGAILPLGRWVLRKACDEAVQWADRLPADSLLSVNVAVRQLQDGDFAAEVAAALEATGWPAHRLQLEVTESAVMGPDADEALDALHRIAATGVRIAMDDFGTGYSNLAALRKLPLHGLKLAGTFLAGLRSAEHTDPVDVEIVTTLVSLAHTLGLVVTAEGVETAAQDELVRAVGCDVGQGWLYARPTPAAGLAFPTITI